ncbi:PD-(D/E)XK nuclease family transposase [sulfur-oxidizing endosymbiont of Gigantopelta aegis]|uniref:PD-(D/E)XK nuclease family transposase n=1 Tax=sulfur-oxidizing endosymbiont of Gigantopelta aegis TaxID=2794934 RepID=UPI0018DCB5D6|nr:PD-(D/E)XK nuclease family transposase [sulfur-oxidizing endosymbiont of Gigantopelta aegis]
MLLTQRLIVFFKAILGSNKHINLLLNFLNATCKDDLDAPIIGLTILNPYSEKEFLSDKLSIVDIKANDKAGNTFQIESKRLTI